MDKVLLVIVLALTSIGIPAVQDNVAIPWTVEERCLPDAISPEETWTFDGEILMSGWGGIHGVSEQFDTPYIMNWGYGLISPDGEWILEQDRTTYNEQLRGGGPLGRHTTIYGDISVTNLTTNETKIFPWDATIVLTSSPYPFGPAGPFWLDDTHFASFYGHGGNEVRMVNVETGNIIPWDNISLDDYEISISPDMSRAVSNARLYDLANFSPIGEENVGTPLDLIRSVWSQDSAMFIDVIYDQAASTNNLSIFDRDGNQLASPFSAQAGGFSLGSWSPTNDYFVFSVDTYHPRQRNTYLLNMDEHIIYDLCISEMSGWAWSSDGTQFATIIGDGQAPVVVVDMLEWQPYIVAHHTGHILFWRSIDRSR